MADKNSKRLKGAAYIRESTEEQDKGFSPKNQIRMIKQYAENHNITIVETYKDLVSGTSVAKRMDFQRMLNDAELKKFDVVLVYHTSRFARNVSEARKHKEHLREDLGIDVLSVTQHFGNWDNPNAFLNEGINELFDAHFSKQLSSWLRDGFQEKRRQGYQLGNPPFGYYKKQLGFDQEKNSPIYEKKWRLHKGEAKLVKMIFELYASGSYSFASLAEKINKMGAKTKQGNPFAYTAIKTILGNRTYMGKVCSPRRGYIELQGTHPIIVSEELFDKVQGMIGEKRKGRGRPVAQHRFYLLQHLLYCYRCRKHLKDNVDNPNAKFTPKMYCETYRDGSKEYPSYACKIKREYKGCKQPNVACRIIDNQVIAFMEGFSLPEDIIEMTMKRLNLLFKESPISNDIGKRIQSLENKRKKLQFLFTETEGMSEEDYKEQVKEINDELAKYSNVEKLKNNQKKKEVFIKDTEKFLRDFKSFWRSDIGNEERRHWIQLTIKRIWVKNRKVVAIEPRDEFKPLFTSHQEVIGQLPLGTPGIVCSRNSRFKTLDI